MAESDKQLALRALREALAAPDARPAERVRAAEALLRAEADSLALAADVLDATDAELLAIARGEEGGTPPERGPTVPAAVAVPSSAVQVAPPANPPGLVLPADWKERTANPFLQRGPKEDPSHQAPRGVPLAPGPAMGPKEDPEQEGAPEPWM